MDELPSIWGRHDRAFIDPIMVKGRLITSILDAPEAWGDRLSILGFKRTNQAWLRLGTLTPSEYTYLSPEIDLIGLRAEEVIDLPASEAEALYSIQVPFDIRDTIIQLWQRQAASVLVALSMEHDINPTRAQAWSFVEAAIAGQITPETETLFGLAFTKMTRDNRMSPDALAYAIELGWESTIPNHAGSPKGTLLLAKGESVRWADSEGVVHEGRLAQKVHVNDIGCWVYKDAPRWSGGYLVTSPLWIKRPQLQFHGSQYDYEYPDHSATENHLSSDETAQTEFVANASQKGLLNRILAVRGYFPGEDWREHCSLLREETISHEANLEDFDNSVEWLGQVEAALHRLSKHFYGNDPICFVIQGHGIPGWEKLTLAINIDGSIQVSNLGHIDAFDDDYLNLKASTSQLEQLRASRGRLMRESSLELAQKFGFDGHIIAATAFATGRPSTWPKISRFFNQQIPIDSLLSMLTVQNGGGDQADYLLRKSARQPVSSSLALDIVLPPDRGNGAVSIQIFEHQAKVLTLEDACEALTLSSENIRWLDFAPTTVMTVYAIEGLFTGNTILPELDQTCLNRLCRDKHQSVIFRSLDEAMSAYETLLDQLEPVTSSMSSNPLKNIISVMDGLHLKSRFLEASQKLRGIDHATLAAFVKAEMARQFKGRLANWTEDFIEGRVNAIINLLREPNAQGVVIIASSTGGWHRMKLEVIKFRDEALSQSRKAELDGAAVAYKTRTRARGTSAVIDGIALADPELCSLLNGDEATFKEEKRSGVVGTYTDTGVVAGLAIKDIRSYDRATLAVHADSMNDAQKTKYLTKDLIWPRKSFEEMKEAGINLYIAYTYDLLWKGLPSKPKSTSRDHTSLFINLLGLMKEKIAPLLDHYSNQGDLKSSDEASYRSFSRDLDEATRAVFGEIPSLGKIYPLKERKIRGTTCYWSHYSPDKSYSMTFKLSKLSWSDVLREKKISKPSTGGSRVAKGNVERVGPDYRGGKSVTGEDFIRTFGFSGIEYGNWTSQKEREKHLNFAYDSMLDFARIMGWEPMTLSLGGKLGLCIGSRGHGGKNAPVAHFDPVNRVINLTRMRGDGSLAHEYFHAVANHYGRLATGTPIDMIDTFAYPLKQGTNLPPRPTNGLRKEVRDGFYDLAVSIMRAPTDDSDERTIENYTALSPMLVAAKALDAEGSRDDYWSNPCEMFARAMEVWFRERMSELGERNDYLVRYDKQKEVSELYPSEDHLARINIFMSPWLEAVRSEVRAVNHPYLGEIEMPILHTEHRSRAPLSSNDLYQLAHNELGRLFDSYIPKLALSSDPLAKAGSYDLAADLVMLNSRYADRKTFYHEAWHVCNAKLLSSPERAGLAALFQAGGPVVASLANTMRAEGYSERVIEHACASPGEAQAYAFELWTEAKFSFDSSEIKAFYRTKSFADGVIRVADLVGADEAEMLFRRFMTGELARRKTLQVAANHVASVPDNQGMEVQGSESGMLVWMVDDVISVAEQANTTKSMRLGI
ncbi:Uncharacterised protein [Pseudomonas luteola]|uniref:Large polyvalent protein-associated domain-containing protein n=1 Tax=Pseudomonas luteola TaxID=47886 RepID=A0A2X2BUC5_PSELU|nr:MULTISPECIES: LPD1 domain-containing protein [Pseudomonas]MBA1250185.1 hypothetical protein [Pseudomonas zeshuii]MBH3440936.1 hypothetical protein [Pseudomonas luteola]SPY99962.1 Uncharacterised protein [Pseudomonas luteola]